MFEYCSYQHSRQLPNIYVHVTLGIVTRTGFQVSFIHSPCKNESHTNHRIFRDVLYSKPTTRVAVPLDEMLLWLRLRREGILEQVHMVTWCIGWKCLANRLVGNTGLPSLSLHLYCEYAYSRDSRVQLTHRACARYSTPSSPMALPLRLQKRQLWQWSQVNMTHWPPGGNTYYKDLRDVLVRNPSAMAFAPCDDTLQYPRLLWRESLWQ